MLPVQTGSLVYQKKMKGKTTFRRVIHILHLWVGIPCALFLFVICLSGTVYVFNSEISRFLDKNLYEINPPDTVKPLPFAQLKAMAEKEKKGYKVVSAQMAGETSEAWILGMQPNAANSKEPGKKQQASLTGDNRKSDKPKVDNGVQNKEPSAANGNQNNKERGGRIRSENFVINPYNGQFRGSDKTAATQFFVTVMQLHRWLLLDNHDIGAAITGTTAMLMVLLQITGLILWFPARLRQWKNKMIWKQGFRIYFKAKAKRLNFDLHKTIGFYVFVFITIMALTGPVLGLDWYRAGFNKLLGVKQPERNTNNETHAVHPYTNATTLPVEQLLAKANTVYPYISDVRIILPKDSTGTIGFQKIKKGFFVSPGTDRVELNPYTGAIVTLDRFSDKTTAQKISLLVKAIHTGEVFGTFSKILYFIACLLATSLPVTGVIIWLGRRQKMKKKKRTPATVSMAV